jgi:type VI secretion system protein ImpB
MTSKSGQKFIRDNRKPRVHIEYEVETFGSSKKIELPFVMGVMSDLSGKSETPKESLDKREFEEFDIDNFENKMSKIAPRAAFHVDNTLTGDGKLAVDLTFNSMDDFSPAAVAKNYKPLRGLLEARTQLNDLMRYMDGKDGAQELLERVLKDPDLMKALAAAKSAEPQADDDSKA